MARTPVSPRRVVWALVLDIVLVLVFAIIGRASHTESLDVVGVLATFWPFLAGLAIGWLASQAWRRPFGIALPGISIWLITVIGGMLFRVISGQGTALAFVIVATVVLGILLVGWRAVAVAITRRRAGS
jgi:hypothetical protein